MVNPSASNMRCLRHNRISGYRKHSFDGNRDVRSNWSIRHTRSRTALGDDSIHPYGMLPWGTYGTKGVEVKGYVTD